MSIKSVMNREKTKLQIEVQTAALKAGKWHSCLNCDFFNAVLPDSLVKVCEKVKRQPPPEVIAVGCELWEETIPF